MIEECMLTTIDNPFDPFTEFDQWYSFDEVKGYHSCSYLGRVARISDSLSETDQALAIETAIDEIIKYNPLHIYKKVKRSDSKSKALENVIK